MFETQSDPDQGSVDNLGVDKFVDRFEMRDFQSPHGLDGQGHRLVSSAFDALAPQSSSRGSQHTEDLCAVETLAFTMVAKAHS
jgi:hypothetical protein